MSEHTPPLHQSSILINPAGEEQHQSALKDIPPGRQIQALVAESRVGPAGEQRSELVLLINNRIIPAKLPPGIAVGDLLVLEKTSAQGEVTLVIREILRAGQTAEAGDLPSIPHPGDLKGRLLQELFNTLKSVRAGDSSTTEDRKTAQSAPPKGAILNEGILSNPAQLAELLCSKGGGATNSAEDPYRYNSASILPEALKPQNSESLPVAQSTPHSPPTPLLLLCQAFAEAGIAVQKQHLSAEQQFKELVRSQIAKVVERERELILLLLPPQPEDVPDSRQPSQQSVSLSLPPENNNAPTTDTPAAEPAGSTSPHSLPEKPFVMTIPESAALIPTKTIPEALNIVNTTDWPALTYRPESKLSEEDQNKTTNQLHRMPLNALLLGGAAIDTTQPTDRQQAEQLAPQAAKYHLRSEIPRKEERPGSPVAINIEQTLRTQELLQNLNPLLDAMGEPMLLIFPMLFGQTLSKLHMRFTPAHSDNSGSKRNSQGFEVVELALHMPGLGDVALRIARRKKELLLNIAFKDERLPVFFATYETQLRNTLETLGYDDVEISTVCDQSLESSPSWYREILGSTARGVFA